MVDAFKKLDPRVQWRNPVMFVVYVGSIVTTVLFVQALGGQAKRLPGFILAIVAVAVVHGAVRQLRRGAGRRPQQGAGRVAAQPEEADLGQEARRAALRRASGTRSKSHEPAQGRRRAGAGRRRDPGRRRGDRGRGVGRRERDHRRIGAGDPRVGRRLLGGDRRHARAVGLDRRARHGQPRRDLRRPHDRDGREAPSARRRPTRSR